MVLSFAKRAAVIVALFISALVPPLGALFDIVPAVQAKMRQDVLTIEPAGGGAGHSFKVEVATSEREKALGLMFRTELGDGEGMLFPYDTAQPLTMWMRNTYIPLDMLFIRRDGTISRIEERAEPLSDRVIASGSAVSAVLEIPGGAAARLGIKPGDKVRHRLFDRAATR